MSSIKKRRTQPTQQQQAVQEDAAGQRVLQVAETAEHAIALKRLRMRFINAGVQALRDYGYPNVSAQNICTDKIYKSFFAAQVQEALDAAQNKHADAQVVLRALLNEMNFAERTVSNTEKRIAIELTYAETNAAIRALAIANASDEMSKSDKAANTWLADRLIRRLAPDLAASKKLREQNARMVERVRKRKLLIATKKEASQAD